MEHPSLVIPAQAGIHMSFSSQEILWPPAFAGVTDLNLLRALMQVSTRANPHTRQGFYACNY